MGANIDTARPTDLGRREFYRNVFVSTLLFYLFFSFLSVDRYHDVSFLFLAIQCEKPDNPENGRGKPTPIKVPITTFLSLLTSRITFFPFWKKKKKLLAIYDSVSYNSLISYECNYGYMLIGDSVRRCERNKMWTGTQPSCKGRTINNNPNRYLENEIKKQKLYV